jgi:hypothetical protein
MPSRSLPPTFAPSAVVRALPPEETARVRLGNNNRGPSSEPRSVAIKALLSPLSRFYFFFCSEKQIHC